MIAAATAGPTAPSSRVAAGITASRPPSAGSPAPLTGRSVIALALVLALEIHRVHGSVGALRGFNRRKQRRLAASVHSIGQHNQHLALRLLLHQFGGRKVNRIVEG